MYGPLEPYLLGMLFHFVVPSEIVARSLSAIASAVMVALCLLATRPLLRPAASLLLILTLIAAENVLGVYSWGNPDMLAWCLGAAGVLCSYRAQGEGSWRWAAAAAALLVLAMLFKQTAAMLAPAPIMAALAERKRTLRTILQSALPLLAILATLGVVWAFYPITAFYMLRVPRMYPVSAAKLLDGFVQMARILPCLWFAAALRLRSANVDDELSRRQRWAALTAATSLPLCALTAAKVGGEANSFTPFWIAAIVLTFLLVASIENGRLPALQLAGLAGAIFFTFMPPSIAPVSRTFHYGPLEAEGSAYRQTVALVRGLPGNVVSLDDPTVLISAGRPPGRSLNADIDTTGWSQRLPPDDAAELRRADFVVHGKGIQYSWVGPSDLVRLGFVQLWANGSYSLWRRRSAH